MPLASTKSEAISHKIGSRSNIYDQARVDGSRTDKQKILARDLFCGQTSANSRISGDIWRPYDHPNGATMSPLWNSLQTEV